MRTSNSASTIFRCISCLFGTCDQTVYAEHIKHCTSESAVTSDGNEGRNDLSKTTKSRQMSYVCGECHLDAGNSKSLLIHQRDFHGKDFEIFACRFCSTYAARSLGGVYKHVQRKHSEGILKSTSYVKLQRKHVNKELPAGNEAAADEQCSATVQTDSHDQKESSTPDTELNAVKSSRSLGLQFLGKQHPDIGRNGYVCQLCSFSHAVSHVVVKHVWQVHKDRVEAEASTKQTTADSGLSNFLYKCDDCGYSTNSRLIFYNHCAHHQFEGPSKCKHCSYCAMTDSAIIKHTHNYHRSQDSGELNVNRSTNESKSTSTKLSAPSKVAKRSGNRSYKKIYQQRKKRWFSCPYCSFKSAWSTSICHHKARVHAELSKTGRKESPADTTSPGHKLTTKDADEAVDVSFNVSRAKQRKTSSASSSHATRRKVKSKLRRCKVCSAKCKSLKAYLVHKESHLDLRRYKCQLCPLRSNNLSGIQKHINNAHKGTTARCVKLSVEDAKQTIEEYKKHGVKRIHSDLRHLTKDTTAKVIELSLEDAKQTIEPSSKRADQQILSGLRRYQCSRCGLRSNYLGNMKTHVNNVHKGTKAQVVMLSLEDAKQTIEAYRKHPNHAFRSASYMSGHRYKARVRPELSKAQRKRSSADATSPSHKLAKMDDSEAVDTSSKCNRAGQQKPSTDNSLSSQSAAAKQAGFTCALCSAQFKSWKCWYAHKQVHLDLRRYQCLHCGLRSNYFTSIRSHMNGVHKDEKTKVTKLSLDDAKQTIEEYRKEHVKAERRVNSGATLQSSKLSHSASYNKSKAVQESSTSPSKQILANSSEHSYAMKEQRIDNSAELHSHVGISVPSLQKCYACSVCKKQLSSRSSISRHIRNIHRSRAKVIVVKRRTSVQKSKLALQRKLAKSKKLNVETCDKTVNTRERDESGGAEYAVQNDSNVSANDVNVTQTAGGNGVDSHAPLQHKVPRRYTCNICPYSANCLRSLVGHRKSHLKRSGYTFACSICPYFACQAAHLVRHMQLHGKQSADAHKTPNQNIDSKTSRHLCEHCPFMSVRRSALIYHRQLHRARPAAPYKCKQCAFWVTEPHHLYKHAVVHTAEYQQKRMERMRIGRKLNGLSAGPEAHREGQERIQLSQTSCSVDVDVAEKVSEYSTSHTSALGSSNEHDMSPVKNVLASDCKLDEVTQNKLVNDKDGNSSMETGESSIATTEHGDVSAHSGSAAASHHLPLWCCEHCPYSTSKLTCFKRHVWLHGKPFPYKCQYCDYSVQSNWQLVSHMLWHFAPNKHLVYAQSVSSLASLPSRLPNRDSVPDSLASIDRYIPSFENSDELPLSDATEFKCDRCPFVTRQRSEFCAHMLCHSRRTAAFRCPYCTFHIDVRETLSTHIRLHFNLPGCRQSCLPPNVCNSEDWKQLSADIEAVAWRSTCSNESNSVLTHDCSAWTRGQVGSASSLATDAAVTENQAARSSDSVDDPAVASSASTLTAVDNEDGTGSTLTLTAASQSVVSDAQHAAITCSTPPADRCSSLVEEPLSTNSVPSLPAVMNKTDICRYCDRVIADHSELAKHEAAHLTGCAWRH